MAFRAPTNNRILPPNSRAVDNAVEAINGLVPVQQRKYANAFRVQGYEVAYYPRLNSGVRCSCHSSRKIRNSILGEDGKASPGAINEILTSTNRSFGGARYGASDWEAAKANERQKQDDPARESNGKSSLFGALPKNSRYPTPDGHNPALPPILVVQDGTVPGTEASASPGAPLHKDQGVFHHASRGDLPLGDVLGAQSLDPQLDPPGTVPNDLFYADNGPVQAVDLDSLVGDLDLGALGWGDHGCPVCLGTSYVGGYSLLWGTRQVLVPYGPEVELTEGIINEVDKPWSASGPRFRFTLVLARGAVSVDALTLWNGKHRQPFELYWMDPQGPLKRVERQIDLLQFCNGRPQRFEVVLKPTRNASEYDRTWTHLEIQLNLSRESAFFEFPKRTKGQDMSLLELTEPFSIVASPNIPHIEPMDIITESVTGKALIVGSVNPWTTRSRANLGWELQVRVLQPSELPQVLPRRNRVPTKDMTTRMVVDNQVGHRRT